MLRRMPALCVWCPVRRSQRVMKPSVSSPARKPGISRTGWPPALRHALARGRSGRAAVLRSRGRYGSRARAAAASMGAGRCGMVIRMALPGASIPHDRAETEYRNRTRIPRTIRRHMRAVTIDDGRPRRRGARRPRAGSRPDTRPGEGGRAERGRHAAAPRSLSGAARATRRTSPGSSWRARWSALGPGAVAVRRGRPRDGDRRRRRPGRAGGGARAPGACRCPTRSTGRRPAASRRSSPRRTTRSSPRPACETGERLLVHGGAGGVGTAAVQLGQAAGAHVTATVRDEAKRDGGHGARRDEVIDPERLRRRRARST